MSQSIRILFIGKRYSIVQVCFWLLVSIVFLILLVTQSVAAWGREKMLYTDGRRVAMTNPTVTYESKKLTADDGAALDLFGISVAVVGDIAVVGAHAAGVGGNEGQGAAYVYYRNQGGPDNWGQVKKLTASDGDEFHNFGISVAVFGDTIIVGSSNEAAYIFDRNQGGLDNWGEARKLTASDGAADDRFGRNVAISGDTAVVTAHRAEIGGNNYQGAAYVFSRNQGGANNWGEVKKLTASDGEQSDDLGRSLAMSGEKVVIGANVGVYIFEQNQGGANNWGEVKKLTASDGTPGDDFGYSVAISGDTVVVGADNSPVSGNGNRGAGYVFSQNQGGDNNWGEVTKLIADDGTANDFFGSSVAVSANTIIIGALGVWIDSLPVRGAAYVFERDNGGNNNWGQSDKLIASDGASYDQLGSSATMTDDTIIVGAVGASVGGNNSQGAAYIFKLLDPGQSIYLPMITKP